MVKVVIVNGVPGSGKTKFQEICDNICEPFRKFPGFKENHMLATDSLSTVAFVKYLATLSGWNGEKTLKNRKFLCDLKALLTEWDNVPYKKIKRWVNSRASGNEFVDWILFVDCREPAEIQKLKEGLNATTVLIRRESVENNETSNASDVNVFDYNYDLTIWNNSDIIELENEAKKFIEYMKKEEVPHYVNVD